METQFHNIEQTTQGVKVQYSLIDDRGQADVTIEIPKVFLLDFIKAGGYNIMDGVVELDLETFYEDNYYQMAKRYINEAHTLSDKYAV